MMRNAIKCRPNLSRETRGSLPLNVMDENRVEYIICPPAINNIARGEKEKRNDDVGRRGWLVEGWVATAVAAIN